jgi:hypothetical protein
MFEGQLEVDGKQVRRFARMDAAAAALPQAGAGAGAAQA